MAAINDPEVRLPPSLLDPPELPRREPVGMERAIEHLERLVGDSRSPGSNTHARHVLSGLNLLSVRHALAFLGSLRCRSGDHYKKYVGSGEWIAGRKWSHRP